VTGSLEGARLGQYDLQAVIGQGRITTTYRADQLRARRAVAVKVFPAALLHEDGFWVRFKREVSVIARLKHAHILPIYDVDRKGNYPYIVFRYLTASSLAEWIRRGPLPLLEVVHIAEQIASALDYAHQQGVVHQAITPSNILLNGDARVYVFDFEIPCIQEAIIRLTGAAPAGSPAYMAPELGAGAPAAPAADIYALGIVLFEALTSWLPFKADTPIDMMVEHRVTPAPPVRSLRPDIPAKTSAAIARALAKLPDDRYQTAGEFAMALRESVRHSGVRRQAHSGTRPGRGRRRWIILLGALALAAVAVLIGVAIGGLLGR